MKINDVHSGIVWSKLEQALLDSAKKGDHNNLGEEMDCPAERQCERRVRATLVRYLLLGGSNEENGATTHEKGVLLSGA